MWSVFIKCGTGATWMGVLVAGFRCVKWMGSFEPDAWYDERGGKTAVDCRTDTPSFLHQSR